MATVEKVVKVLFNAEDNVTKVLKSMEGGFAGIGDAAAPFAKLGDAILKVEGAITLLGAATVAYAAYQFAQFETASTSLSKILSDDLKPQVKGMTDDIIDMSNAYGIAAVDLLNTATDFKKAGADFEDLNRLTEDSVKLFAAAAEEGFGMAEATDTIVRVVKGFNVSFNESANIIDTVNILSNKYATSAGKLAEGLARVSPVAKDMGLSIKEAAAFVTPIIEVFQSGEIAGQALSTSFQRIISPIADVKKALASMGVSQTDANGKLKSGKAILFEVAEALKTVDGAQKIVTISQLAGIRQGPKFTKLVGSWETALGALAVANEGAGSATAELTARLEDTQKQFDRVSVSFNNIFLKFGENFKDATGDAAESVADLFVAIQKEIDSGTFDPLIASVGDVGNKMTEVFKSVAENLPEAFADLDFSKLINSFEDLQGSVADILSAMFGDVDITTVNGLTDAIQNIVDAVTLVNNVTSGIIDAWKPVIGLFADVTLAFGEMSESSQKSLGKFLGWSQVIVAGTAGVAAFSVAMIGATKAMGGTLALTQSLVFQWTAGGAAALALGVAIGTLARQIPGVDTAVQGAIESVDKFFNLGIGDSTTASQLAATNTRFEEARASSKRAREGIEEFNKAVEAVPREPLPATYKKGLADFEAEIKQAKNAILEMALFGDEIPEDAFDFRLTFTNQTELDQQKKKIQELREEAEYTKEVFSEDVEIDIKINAQSADEAELDLFKLAQERTAIISASVNEDSLKSAQDAVDKAISEGNHVALIEALADQDSLEASKAVIQTEVDGTKYFTSIGVRVDNQSKQKTLKELAEDLPAEKQIKIALELEQQKVELAIAKLDTLAELAGTKFEWNAKLDIAEVEAESKKAIALSETLSAGFAASGDIISSALGALAGGVSFTVFNLIKNQLDIQNDIQKKNLELTERKIILEEKLAAAKAERLLSGEPLINIKTEGLQPHMAAFMFELAEAFQVEASLEGGEALVDI